LAEALFYHLVKLPLDKVLPGLVERALAMGWRCAIEASEERARALDDLLWTYSDDSFLPHGLEADDGPGQPVVLVSHSGNPNGAAVRFIVDGAALPADALGYRRLVVIFDGNDAEALAAARERWREAKGLGLETTYWQQNDVGRWEKRA
jgi:DNA polymerase III subunit chi